MKGIFLDLETVDRGDLDLRRLEDAASAWRMYREPPVGNLIEHVGDADLIVTNKVPLDSHTLKNCPHLRLICIAATGTDKVDLEAARKGNITVCNARGYATASVVEHVFATMLTLIRRLPEYRQAASSGGWRESGTFCMLDFPIGELCGRTLGVIGYGELGRAVSKIAAAFGMHVLIAERLGAMLREGRASFESVLRQSDVITLHTPLTPDTRGLVGERELRQIKPGALLIHTARGGIIDEHALLQALQHGRLGGAAVDVLSQEPPVSGNPLLDVNLPNLLITPHIAWASREARQRLVDQVADNIQRFSAGRPANVVA